MIKNKEYYKITGDINADFGVTVTNPIIKIFVILCEYNIYYSEDLYLDGSYFFKARKDGKRLLNFTYPISGVSDWGYPTYKQDQRKIRADTFGFDLENVELVQED